MRFITSFIRISLLLSIITPIAQAEPFDPKLIPQLVLSAGRIDSRNDESGEGNGWFLDSNYSRTFLNGGVSFKRFSNENAANIYVGTGISNILQLQVGLTSQGGSVTRIRHDLNLSTIYDFLTGYERNRYNTSLGNRLTLTFALEKYKQDERFDNFHIGVGLSY